MNKTSILLTFFLLFSCTDSKLVNNNFILINKEIKNNFIIKSFLDNQDNIDISKLKGIKIINFWASWCNPCIDEVNHLNDFAYLDKENFDKIIAINIFDNLDDAKEFINIYSAKFNNYYDETKTIPIEFGVSGVPETFFMKDNKIIYKFIGKIDLNLLNEGLAKTNDFSE
tara:strand:- start:36125 stop:36634 length:510 start_codon:yes stop_codon:yes gene_type:complete